MSCTYTELRGHTRERYLTSQMLRPSQAHGSPFVGQSGEAREPSGKRRTASPTERNSSSGHWATTHPGGRSGENANTPNRLKHRALLKLEPRTRMGKGRARTSQRTSTKHEGKRTALTLLALPLQCASEIPIRETSQTLHQNPKSYAAHRTTYGKHNVAQKSKRPTDTHDASHPARALVFQPRLARATVSAFRISLRKISFLAFPLMK